MSTRHTGCCLSIKWGPNKGFRKDDGVRKVEPDVYSFFLLFFVIFSAHVFEGSSQI
jgi:hypothetical protein